MPMRPCLTCGRLSPASRCPTHARTAEAARTRRKRVVRPYTWTEQQRRKHAVDDHVAQHGYVCPGYRRPAHESHDLTADHVVAVANGGAESGELQVLCRACNSAKLTN
jgi:5-methylcytosine-specific restriction protein A